MCLRQVSWSKWGVNRLNCEKACHLTGLLFLAGDYSTVRILQVLVEPVVSSLSPWVNNTRSPELR